MCGIVYAQSLIGEPVNQAVWDQYEKQKTRGTEGFGVFDGRFTTKAAVEKKIKRWFKRDGNERDMILFHHRMPTSTINVKRAAHPFNTGTYFGNARYVLVHNGVISNSSKLKEDHEKLGIKYQSVLEDGKFNDSEALLWDFALTMEGKQDSLNAYGGIAFVCIKMVDDKPEKMFFARNYGRPLNLFRNKRGIMLSSEGPGENIKENTLHIYNYKLNRLTDKYFRVPNYQAFEKSWDDTRKNYQIPAYSNTHQSRVITDPSGLFEYEDEDGNRAFVPLADSPQSIGDILSARPTPQEVYSEMLSTLAMYDGHYQQALNHAEIEYETLEYIVNPSPAVKKEMAILQKVIDTFWSDANFSDPEAVHPLWSNEFKKDTGHGFGKYAKAKTVEPDEDDDSVLVQVLTTAAIEAAKKGAK